MGRSYTWAICPFVTEQFSWTRFHKAVPLRASRSLTVRQDARGVSDSWRWHLLKRLDAINRFNGLIVKAVRYRDKAKPMAP